MNKFTQRLKKELIPAMGCTEPISICYAAAKAREVLGEFPDSIRLQCSGSLYKNTKGVNIPNTNGLTGVKTSAILGTVGGDATKELEVLASITEDDLVKTKELLNTDFCDIELLKDGNNVHVIMEAISKDNKALVEIVDSHTNIITIKKNDEYLLKKDMEDEDTDAFNTNFDEIYDYIEEMELSDVQDMIEKQISYNSNLATIGIDEACGLEAGRALKEQLDMNDPLLKARAYTTAACDARMHGVSHPAMSIGGSGNQGITTSMPVYFYGKETGFSDEEIIRAVTLSDLLFLHFKEGMGRLSAFCSGIISSATSLGAIMYLETKDKEKVKDVVLNTLANVSGIFCDGAKGSCALKISSCLDGAILGYYLAENDTNSPLNTGILAKDFEDTVSDIGMIVKDGMKETNDMIIQLMYESDIETN